MKEAFEGFINVIVGILVLSFIVGFLKGLFS